MDCRTFDTRLEDYLEDGLDFSGRFAMERHAQQCFRCAKTLADAQELHGLVRQYQKVTAPPDFENVLMRRIQTENIRPRRSIFRFTWPIWKLATAGTMAVALLGTAVFLLSSLPEKSESAATPRPAPPSFANPAPANALSLAAPPVTAQISEVAGKSRPASQSPESVASDYPLESADAPDFVEVMVPGPGDRMRVVRLPKTIRMRYGQPSEQYFIRNVSH
jgi:hypothetical protein